nr:MAG: hypothetical protein EOO19_12850 [Chryseobacterium sp.]
MKKLLISAALAACFALGNAKAQTVNGVRVSEIKCDYIQVKSVKRTFSDKVFISLEYGQNVPHIEDSYVKDDNGKRMEFDSALQFVNSLKHSNFELFQVFSEQAGADYSRHVYVFKRK